MGWYAKKPNRDNDLWEIRDEPDGKLFATAFDEKLAEAIVCLLEKTRMIVSVNGGCVQGLSLDGRLHDFLAGYLVDFDTEGCEEDEDSGVFDIDATYGRCRVSVGEYPFDALGYGDEESAVDAYHDPSLRMKPEVWEREVTGTVLYSNGTWETHVVKVRLDHHYSDEKSWTAEARLWLLSKATEELKAKKKENVHVTDVTGFTCGAVSKIEEPEDGEEEEAEGDEDS